VDIEIRQHGHEAIESHPMFELVTMIEGSSTAAEAAAQVISFVNQGETGCVIPDSGHTKLHAADELAAVYDPVTSGSYGVATNGIIYDLSDVPRGQVNWHWNHPADATTKFPAPHPGFVARQPAWPSSESEPPVSVTLWPGAWLSKR